MKVLYSFKYLKLKNCTFYTTGSGVTDSVLASGYVKAELGIIAAL